MSATAVSSPASAGVHQRGKLAVFHAAHQAGIRRGQARRESPVGAHAGPGEPGSVRDTAAGTEESVKVGPVPDGRAARQPYARRVRQRRVGSMADQEVDDLGGRRTRRARASTRSRDRAASPRRIPLNLARTRSASPARARWRSCTRDSGASASIAGAAPVQSRTLATQKVGHFSSKPNAFRNSAITSPPRRLQPMTFG